MNDTGHFPINRLRAEGSESLRILLTGASDTVGLDRIRVLSVGELYDLARLCDEEPALDDITRCVPCWAYIEAQRREDAAKAPTPCTRCNGTGVEP